MFSTNTVGLVICIAASAVVATGQASKPWLQRAKQASAADQYHDVSLHGQQTSIQPYRRSLQQHSALSNSNGCITSGVIPKCEPGACATRNVMGVASWVCLRCLANYVPVVDSSGQDNILQCVCPAGHFEADASATRCTRCSRNSFCPGGDKAANPVSRGELVTCGGGLVTRNTGARSQVDCVAPAGYARTEPNQATACSHSTYAPSFNRLARCLRCQSGLQEAPTSGLADGQRDSKRVVCKVPPGRYMSQGLVRICPQGFWREEFLDFDHPNATICQPCNPGVTTDGAGAGSRSLCNRVLPGHGISTVFNVSGTQSAPLYPSAGVDGLPSATVCNIGFYSFNGFCARCPYDTVTLAKGATAVEACVVPPGYMTTATSMTQCQSGTYREGWVMHSDLRAAACTPCGADIASEPRDLDESPLAADGSLVRATSSSCYVDAGMGMIAQGANTFAGMSCPANTYGAADRVYGLRAAPCKPCPRNMITDGITNVNSSDTCINPNGFGYASEGASRCAPGFYALKGSRKTCQRCPACRTTLDNPAFQRLISDCLVQPGCGVADSSANLTDAFNPDTSGLDSTALAQLPTLECPVGYYGPGNATGAKCLACPIGSTTQEPGKTAETDCSVCVAGYGLAAPSYTLCTLCDYGTYQPGGLTQCQACPNTLFYAPIAGGGPAWTSQGTTLFKGAMGVEACVPVQSQLSPEAGQAYFSPASAMQLMLRNSTATTLAACLAACGSEGCCLAQWEAAAQTCQTVSLRVSSAGAGGYQLQYKLPPSTLVAASSVDKTNAKMMASGYYAYCTVAEGNLAAWETAGVTLTTDARTFSSDPLPVWDLSLDGGASCRRNCDNSNVCWGFIYNSDTEICLYKGGVDALNYRSFFVLPGTPSPGPQPGPQPGMLSQL